MYSERAKTLLTFSLMADMICIAMAFGSALLLRSYQEFVPFLRSISSHEWTMSEMDRAELAAPLITFLLVWLAYLRRSGLYTRRPAEKPAVFVPIYFKGVLIGVLLSGAVLYGLKMPISRLFFSYFFTCGLVLLISKQFLFSYLHLQLRTSDSHRRHALVIGSPASGAWFSSIVASASSNGYSLVGLLLPDDCTDAETGAVPIIGTVSDLDRVLLESPVDEVFIVGSGPELANYAPIAETLIHRGRVVSLVSTLASSKKGIRGRITEFTGVPMISYGPMPRDEVQSGTKRILDVTVSGLALIVLAPVFAVVAILIKILDPGPVFFSHQRLGWGGKRFKLHKFRSMKVNAEKILRSNPILYKSYVENDYKIPEEQDPRISPLGRFLRKSSLDELPQFWNVFKGEMTLVGPRPIVPAELEKYQPYEDLFLSVKPGITGRWQADGRSNVKYPERAFMDIDYIGDHSALADLAIVIKTVPSVIRGKGAR